MTIMQQFIHIQSHIQSTLQCPSGHTRFFSWDGWRLVFFTVGLVSISTGALNWLYAHDPNYTPDGKAKLMGKGVTGFKGIWQEMKLVMCVPTFLLIVMQVSTALKSQSHMQADMCCKYGNSAALTSLKVASTCCCCWQQAKLRALLAQSSTANWHDMAWIIIIEYFLHSPTWCSMRHHSTAWRSVV